MKKLVQLTLITAVVVLFGACQTEPKQLEISATESASKSEVKKTEILAENKSAVDMKVEGMVCAMGCAKFIEEKVADLDGIVLSEVDFVEGTAHFEFDKTALNSDEIKTFINEIHDGQYKASIADSEGAEEEIEDSEEEQMDSEDEETTISVREHVNISFPELFTYFLKRLR